MSGSVVAALCFWGRETAGDMSDQLEREEFYTALGALTRSMDTGFSGLNTRLDKLNGKTEAHGNRLTAIETREVEREKSATRDTAARTTGVAGMVMSAVALIWQKFFQ